MTGFSISWLDLRESADFKARDKFLALQALQWLERSNGGADKILLDLGSGTGSTLRAFASLGAHHLVWRLVDYNSSLLDEALKRHSKDYVIEDYQADLNVINELPLVGVRLVTASALFDLVSCEFIDALIERLATQTTALYVALNYDGVTEWSPAHPLDAAVLDAFNRDQQRDKGFGPALGPHASAYLISSLQKAGYAVATAASPWQLSATDHALVSQLVYGIAEAVAKHFDQFELNNWKDFRLAHAASGICKVGHQDLLALPL
jgi:SAM-dependent methyltransferase